MKRKVLVTGANGFIGRYVVSELCRLKYDVAILVRRNDIGMIEGTPVLVVETDICEEGVIQQVASQVGRRDIIIHLAADVSINGNHKTILTNCLGTYHMAILANLILAKQFIYISSIPVIGVPRYLPVTEEHPVKANTLYHATKCAGEQIVNRICFKEIRKLILRISSPIGPGMKESNFLSVLLKKCIANERIEIYGNGRRKQNYIDVRDIVSAILCGIVSDASGLYLIAGRQEITNLDLAFLCKEIMNSSSQVLWGLREDPEEKNQWVISGKKAEEDLGFLPKYTLMESISWIGENFK